jgi:hypothetical protein
MSAFLSACGWSRTCWRRASQFGDKWHLDVVVISINGKKHWLWRAVDADGFVLDALVQGRQRSSGTPFTSSIPTFSKPISLNEPGPQLPPTTSPTEPVSSLFGVIGSSVPKNGLPLAINKQQRRSRFNFVRSPREQRFRRLKVLAADRPKRATPSRGAAYQFHDVSANAHLDLPNSYGLHSRRFARLRPSDLTLPVTKAARSGLLPKSHLDPYLTHEAQLKLA